jgi:deoxyribodipyrimidine photo-lyase
LGGGFARAGLETPLPFLPGASIVRREELGAARGAAVSSGARGGAGGETVLWWIRRDVRLRDNQALQGALARAGPVIPVFILDPGILRSRYHVRAERRKAFLFGGLRLLDEALRQRGSRLIVREGSAAAVLPVLVRETKAFAVFAEEDYSPSARARDGEIARQGVGLHLTPGVSVRHPAEVRKADGGPYTVFTPFRRAWLARPVPTERDLLPAPRSLPAVPGGLKSIALPRLPLPEQFPPGEAEARGRLVRFASGARAPIYQYGEGRNRLDGEGTSTLSPYLRFGMVSAREAVVGALRAMAEAPGPATRASTEVWLAELIWREFYLAILYHFPYVLRTAFNPALREIPWRIAPQDLEAWRAGRTGYPVVDAAMRQLRTTGWMHNRGRMIAASFLVKDLLIDWTLGEQWFMEQLVDGDPAANNGGWQWTAGVGTDAAPYFRIFNPVLQGRRFDPQGRYVRRFVPELARVPERWIHEPWRMSPAEQAEAGCVIGRDYPAPILDRTRVRDRTLAAYQRSQERARGVRG